MRPKAIVFALGMLVPITLFGLFVVSGGMPVATRGRPLPLERFVAQISIHAAMRGETQRTSPFPPDEANLRLGAQVYSKDCAVCHGYPHEGPTHIAAGMFPRPPRLLPPKKGVTDDPVGETYWKVKNGIRLTGMPGFGEALTDHEMWAVSSFLLSADHLPPGILESIKNPD